MSDLTVNRFRTARGRVLRKLIDELSEHLGRNISILDVGGREEYWENVGTDNIHKIILLNNDESELDLNNRSALFRTELGDACCLSAFENKSVDLVHSNSVIEHVGNWERMSAMASETLRVGLSGWIQTPAWSFPIEPHFKLPFLHWTGQPLRRALLRLSKDYGKLCVAERRYHVDRINLLSYNEFKALFSDADIFIERLILAKSYSAIWKPVGLGRRIDVVDRPHFPGPPPYKAKSLC